MVKDRNEVDPLAALRSGAASAAFRREMKVIPETGGLGMPALMPRQPSSQLPLIRRIARRAIRVVRPLAMPFLHRFQSRLSHAVNSSTAMQEQNQRLGDILSATAALRNAILYGNSELRDALDAQRTFLDARISENSIMEVSGKIDRLHSLNERQMASMDRLQRARTIPLRDEVLVRTSFGWLLVPAEDYAIIASMGEGGDALEPGTVEVIQRILQPGDFAVDIGSNVGAVLLVMAASVGPLGRLVACEPTPRCFEALKKTAVLNGLEGRTELLPIAIGAEAGNTKLHIGSNSSLNSVLSLPQSSGDVDVEIRPLDQVIASDQIPALVKIDVEGLELEVLRGMSQIIDRAPNIALIAEFGPSHLARAGITPAEWLGEFESRGFTPWAINEDNATISKATAASLDGVYSINLLMLRRSPENWPNLMVSS